jgi:hypothetical protein
MKLKTGLLLLLSSAAISAHAVTLNTDALKSMQEEGHKIVAESQGARSFKSVSGHCLDSAGKALLLKNCADKAAGQKWHFDDKNRLVAHDGRCVGGNAQLQSCGGAPAQQWQLDNKGRLANGAGQCLQPQGNATKPGAKVTAQACGGSPQQVWK